MSLKCDYAKCRKPAVGRMIVTITSNGRVGERRGFCAKCVLLMRQTYGTLDNVTVTEEPVGA